MVERPRKGGWADTVSLLPTVQRQYMSGLIPFAEFAPDRAVFDPSASSTLQNVLPKANSFGPFPSLVTISTALSERPQGTILAYVANGNYQLYVGSASKLWKFDSATLGWTDVSKLGGYTTSAETLWSFAQFGNLVIATNGSDAVQYIDVTVATQFADLSADAPKAKFVTTLGDFVILGNLTSDERAIQWCGLADATFWTPGQRSSDFQSFPDGGEIVSIIGGASGLLVLQNELIRQGALALDTPLVMTFEETLINHGCLSPRSAVPTGHGTFYLSDDGFYKYNVPPEAVGRERVDNFFLDDVVRSEIYHMYGNEDPNRKIVYWAYRSTSNTTPWSYDKVLLYHYGIDKWTTLDPGVLMTGLIDMAGVGYTLDSLSSLGIGLDSLPFSLDSRAWSGGSPALAAFDSNYKLGFFSGTPMEAKLQTADVQLTPGRRTFVSGFRVISDASSPTGRIATKDRAGQARTWKSSAAVNRTGLIPMRADGRFHRFEVTIPSGASWNDIIGVEPSGTAAGRA